MWFITFSTRHPTSKTSLCLNRCLIKVKTKTLQVCLNKFCDLNWLLFINKDSSILAAIAFTSCWQLYRQLSLRTHFLPEHIYKRLTFSLFVIQSEKNQRNSMGLLSNAKIIFLIWNSKYKYTTWNFLFICTYDY